MKNLPLSAQDFSGLARIDTAASSLRATDRGASLRLRLSQGVPWRAYTLDGPPRLVLDFREVDFSGLNTGDFVQTDQVLGLRFGMVRPGVSRLVAELAAPLALAQAAMTVLPDTGVAEINIDLQEVDKETFLANSGVLRDPAFDLPDSATPPTDPAPVLGDGPVVVVLDPGHGGIDPGAQRGGESEKNLMLAFARELRDTLRRVGGFEVVLTREDDRFVSLERRIAIAHQARAHLFLSLHADALGQGQGQASGATVYLLERNASDEATRLLAERHDRDDLVSG
ncbi:MAG: N-acetylmuramoyl-L-alanine amidase, partial [Lutimaribacter sp.]